MSAAGFPFLRSPSFFFSSLESTTMTLRNALLSLGCTLALATSAMAADPLKIGLMEDVSGDLAVLGKPKLNGSLLREG